MTSLTLKRYILKHLLIDNYKRDYRLSLTLPKYLNDTLIGLILSDGGLQRSSETSNVRLSVIMSIINCPYFFHYICCSRYSIAWFALPYAFSIIIKCDISKTSQNS